MPIRKAARCTLAAVALFVSFTEALAQESDTETTPFAGSALILAVNESGKVVLTFEGQILATADVIYLKVATELEQVPVAVFGTTDFAGEADNVTACSKQIIVWKEPDEPVRHAPVYPHCRDSTYRAVTDYEIFFVPVPGPGTQTEQVMNWVPHNGLMLSGTLSFEPQPNTRWGDIKWLEQEWIFAGFFNEAVYRTTQALLGERLDEVIDALRVSSGFPTELPSGIIYGTGCGDVGRCVGGEPDEGFMGVDPKARALYFAHRIENRIDMWPDEAHWPAELVTAMKKSLSKS